MRKMQIDDNFPYVYPFRHNGKEIVFKTTLPLREAKYKDNYAAVLGFYAGTGVPVLTNDGIMPYMMLANKNKDTYITESKITIGLEVFGQNLHSEDGKLSDDADFAQFDLDSYEDGDTIYIMLQLTSQYYEY